MEEKRKRVCPRGVGSVRQIYRCLGSLFRWHCAGVCTLLIVSPGVWSQLMEDRRMSQNQKHCDTYPRSGTRYNGKWWMQTQPGGKPGVHPNTFLSTNNFNLLWNWSEQQYFHHHQIKDLVRRSNCHSALRVSGKFLTQGYGIWIDPHLKPPEHPCPNSLITWLTTIQVSTNYRNLHGHTFCDEKLYIHYQSSHFVYFLELITFMYVCILSFLYAFIYGLFSHLECKLHEGRSLSLVQYYIPGAHLTSSAQQLFNK